MGLNDKPAEQMDPKAFLRKANERAAFVTSAMGSLTAKLRELKPRIEELRGDFWRLKGNQTIAGCKTWTEFCQRKLHRTASAVRKLLATGGRKQQKSAGEIPAPTEDNLKSKTLEAIRKYTRSSTDNTVGSLLVDLYPDGESTSPAPRLSQSNTHGTPQVTPSQPVAKTGALTATESFHDYALTHFEEKSQQQVLEELGSIWNALFPNASPLTLLSDVKLQSKKSPASVEQRNAQVGDVR
jgi:hypothetical protein